MYYEAGVSASSSDMMAVLAAFGMGIMIVGLVMSVIMIISLWKIYEKAEKPGWGSLIPFYTNYLLAEITYGNGWLFLILCIPFVNFVFLIMMAFKLAKVFGKGTGFGFGLWLLPVIFYPILAFGDAEYQGVE